VLRGIGNPEDVALAAEQCGDRHWTVSICSADSVGMLAAIAGLFAAHRLDSRNGEVFTLRGPGGPPWP
jgi:hypothetical protein